MADEMTIGLETPQTAAPDKVRAPARNFLVLFLSQGFGKFTGLVFGFVAARLLGASGFGDYAVVSSFLSYFLVLTDFGLSPFLVREMSQNPSARSEVFARGLALRMTLAAGGYCCILAVALALGWPRLFLISLAVGGLGTFLHAWNSSLTDLFTSREKLRYAAALDMACQAVFLTLVVVLLLRGANILGIFVSLVAANGLRAAVLGWLGRDELRHLRWSHAGLRACAWELRSAMYFALLGLLSAAYFKIDLLLMYGLGGSDQVGWYEGGYRFLEAVMVLSTSFMIALFPMLSRLGGAQAGKEEMIRAYHRASKFLIWSGIFCALAVSRVAAPLTQLCYGKDFGPTAQLVPVLMIALALIHVNAPFGRILLACGKEKQLVHFSVLTVTCNILLNLLLIPGWGAFGAAIATALSEIVSFAVFYPMVRAQLGPLPWGGLLPKPLACAAVFGVVAYLTGGMNPWISATLASAGFAGAMFALRALDEKDWQILRRVFFKTGAA